MKRVVHKSVSPFEIDVVKANPVMIYAYVTDSHIYKKEQIEGCFAFTCVNHPNVATYVSRDLYELFSDAITKHKVYQFHDINEFLVWLESIEHHYKWDESSQYGCLLKRSRV